VFYSLCHGYIIAWSLMVFDYKAFAPHPCGFESWRSLNCVFGWSYPAYLRNAGGSSQVSVHAWNNAQRGTWCLFVCLFWGFTLHRHSIGHIATFQLYWWWKTSGALPCITSGTNGHLMSTSTDQYNYKVIIWQILCWCDVKFNQRKQEYVSSLL
jgi:hypothetical protein